MNDEPEYEHAVYGLPSALVRDPDGTVREATPEELRKLSDLYALELRQSLRVVRE